MTPQDDLAASLAAFPTSDMAVLWLKVMATGISFTLFVFVAVFTAAALRQRDGYAGVAAQFALANLFAVLYIGSDAAVRFDVLTGDLGDTLFWYRLALSAVYLSLAAYINLYWAMDRRHHGRHWIRYVLWAFAGTVVASIWVEHPSLIIASEALTVRDMSVFADYGAAAPWFFGAGLVLFLGFCLGIVRVMFDRVGGLGRVVNLAGFALLLVAGVHDSLREFGVYLLPFSTLGLGYMCFQIGAFAFIGLHYANTLRERGRQERQIEQLTQAVARDKLSGLYARRYLEPLLDEGAVTGAGLLFLDLDDFKAINDRHGHHAGDAGIAAVGRVLTEHVRAGDMACRWGGDEFLVLVGEADDVALRGLAERLGEAVRAIRLSEAPGLQVGASMGFALLRDDDWRISLSRADQALYEAKQAGKDRAVRARLPDVEEGKRVANSS
ncbi:GGDEF domain-containing protein [Ectothiorhodospiraceae bacterium WFHF3C12]|nr:GGDEF domain-containing protein [Ectothiorhodospiraceae bacterium WFHF3C12]